MAVDLETTLGASQSSVLWMVMRETLAMLDLGTAFVQDGLLTGPGGAKFGSAGTRFLKRRILVCAAGDSGCFER